MKEFMEKMGVMLNLNNITEFYLQLLLDYSQIIITVNITIIITVKVMTKSKPCTLQNAKTNWLSYFQKLLIITLDNSILLKNDIVSAIESFEESV